MCPGGYGTKYNVPSCHQGEPYKHERQHSGMFSHVEIVSQKSVDVAGFRREVNYKLKSTRVSWRGKTCPSNSKHGKGNFNVEP